MPIRVLESGERVITGQLLSVNDVFDIYQSNSARWARAVTSIDVASQQIVTETGESVDFSPREILEFVVSALQSSSTRLFAAVGRLQRSSTVELQEIYRELESLEVLRASRPEARALFLLLAKLSEDKRIFDEQA